MRRNEREKLSLSVNELVYTPVSTYGEAIIQQDKY
jgi:hypothetical protein